MKKILVGCLLLVSFGLFAQSYTLPTAARTIPFNNGWLFIKDSTARAEQPGHNDAHWRRVDLPHDWSIEDLPNQRPGQVFGPFDRSSIGAHNTGFTVGGTGWYRKRFRTGPAQQNKRITIHFDGVHMNSDVWLNGHHLGFHPYGYTPFHYDLTPYLRPAGQDNVLAVRVRNWGKNSRWYSGSGIYRHVWLTATDPVHVAPGGVFVTTPEVSEQQATVQVQAQITNQQTTTSTITLTTTLVAPDGKTVGRSQRSLTLDANASATDTQRLTLTNPVLWSVDSPRLDSPGLDGPGLYKAITEVRSGSRVLDRVETPFGVRSIRFSSTEGFLLNGKRLLLKGGCIHHDNGPLGAVAIDRAEERKIEILKKNGFNAIRSSHNPPSQALLDACDRLGMLVINEAFDMWQVPKNPQDYHLYFKEWWQKDLEALILRDRNHPSVILWSIGNEIPERVDSTGLRITRQLIDLAHRLDPTRPTTEAICGFWEPMNKGRQWRDTAPAFALLDVGGYNYMWQHYESDHQQHPDRIMLGTESFAKEALENWNKVEKHPYVIGDFVWTAMDYLGEASIGHTVLSNQKDSPILGWPWFNGWCGDIDLIGHKKPQSYYRDVVWRQSPIALAVHQPIPEGLTEVVSKWGWPEELPSWTWPGAEGKPLQVRVFSRAPRVRLTLNGKPIGEQAIADTSITALFEVPYQPGVLKAVNVVDGKETESVVLTTVGAPKQLRLTADRPTIRASRNDLSYVTVEVVDEQGQVVPGAEVPVQFALSGAGELAAVGNANPTDVSSFQKPQKNTFRGRALAIIRPVEKPGTITLKATAPGLAPATLTVTTK
ncbi:glycoside hydrolase family 2 TIM barrel-domain containing protein [Telluribacter sp. SYSU D00476]|uniref:glycoside hydrolase family 2 TIM barrel-domain containing protein n=1 Tax=Telluribacter sp. SYSU D00476 TaxID=2811430 RepID=UPI001FF23203|nr:glycoside hydrolase family 2 TIM barrel-domain containing protein [Telluribacter sp. SYSU D00476]